ncbi:hypothetical protein [Caulobacter radicis]|uniref:Uncharacterized protein n=1 Tax=Caulobacter radicis TaxID=2172650 RepID=A0A2T9JIZ5_9CAUL|nr:hypothetical protein [Caulobacter radicis]PVM83667.1 hypothetical protein DDF65_08955 [Caulobacter radicis]
MDVGDHIERVAQGRPGLGWRNALMAALAVTGVATPGTVMVVGMRLQGSPLSVAEWIGTGVFMLAPAAIFLAGFALWRRGSRRRRPALRPPTVLDAA